MKEIETTSGKCERTKRASRLVWGAWRFVRTGWDDGSFALPYDEDDIANALDGMVWTIDRLMYRDGLYAQIVEVLAMKLWLQILNCSDFPKRTEA